MDRIRVWARFSAQFQTGPGAHPASCTMGIGSISLGGRGVALTIPHVAPSLKRRYSYTSTPIWVKCNFPLFTFVLCKGREKTSLKMILARSPETSIHFYNKTTGCRSVQHFDLHSQRSFSVYINLRGLMNLDFW